MGVLLTVQHDDVRSEWQRSQGRDLSYDRVRIGLSRQQDDLSGALRRVVEALFEIARITHHVDARITSQQRRQRLTHELIAIKDGNPNRLSGKSGASSSRCIIQQRGNHGVR